MSALIENAELLQWVGRTSLQAGVLAVVVLVLQRVLRPWTSARFRANLWLLVVARLLMPASPRAAWSPYALLEGQPAPVNVQPRVNVDGAVGKWGSGERAIAPVVRRSTPVVVDVQVEEPVVDAAEIPVVAVKPLSVAVAVVEKERPVSWTKRLMVGWLAGVAVVLGWMAYGTIRLALRVRRMRVVEDEETLGALESACRKVGLRRRPELLEGKIAGPALVGVWRPRILLPAELVGCLSRRELELIFLHEAAHVMRRDVLMNWVAGLLSAIHWFNPVLWLAFGRMRIDRELACDERVLLALSSPPQRQEYGHTMIRLMEIFPGSRVAGGAVGGVGILGSASQVKRRITMIARFNSGGGRRRHVLALACALGVAGLFFTDRVGGQVEKKTEATSAAAGAPPGTSSATTPRDVANDPNASPAERLQAARRREQLKTDPASAQRMADKNRAEIESWERQKNAEIERAVEADPTVISLTKDVITLTIQRGQLKQETGPDNPAVLKLNKLIDLTQKQLDQRRAELHAKFREQGFPRGRSGPPVAGDGGFGDPVGGHAEAVRPAPAAGAAPVDVLTRRLQQRVPEVKFEASALSDVLDYVREMGGLNLIVDWKSLEDAGFEKGAPVTLRLKDVSLDTALRHILRQVSPTLTYEVDGEVLMIVHGGDAGVAATRTYDVRDLIEAGPNPPVAGGDFGGGGGGGRGRAMAPAEARMATLSELISSSVERARGEQVLVKTFNTKLVVTGSQAGHREVTNLLKMLREGEEAPRTTAPAKN